MSELALSTKIRVEFGNWNVLSVCDSGFFGVVIVSPFDGIIRIRFKGSPERDSQPRYEAPPKN